MTEAKDYILRQKAIDTLIAEDAITMKGVKILTDFPGANLEPGCADKLIILGLESQLRFYSEKEAELTLEMIKLKKELENCRNELCLKCGDYKMAHKGACDGCQYSEWDVNKIVVHPPTKSS